ncbi:MAG: methyltransferase domain-containing protein [Deltaproteobacteria bacterium]|nr:methyltransferase domain-containing protein [Deltaproteobacteria bacterium]
MLRRMMDILCCPVCKADLSLSVESLIRLQRPSPMPPPGCRSRCEYARRLLRSEEDRRRSHDLCEQCYWEDVDEGSLSCPRGHTFPISGSIPRLLPTGVKRQRTRETFDVEWTGFKHGERIYGHSREEELEDFFCRMAVEPALLKGKTVLDAGCGVGRLALGISRLAREVVAMDFSEGVEGARETARGSPHVHIVQGDLMCPPFRRGSFDHVYSKGVLHYVPEVQACIGRLTELVREGGALSITLYPRMSRPFEVFNRLLRVVTVRLPLSSIYVLSHLLAPLLPLSWRWSGLRYRPIEPEDRAHMIFNWLSSEYQNRADTQEVAAWLRDLGFTEVRVSKIPVGITATKFNTPFSPAAAAM